jgi:hypothetical protein
MVGFANAREAVPTARTTTSKVTIEMAASTPTAVATITTHAADSACRWGVVLVRRLNVREPDPNPPMRDSLNKVGVEAVAAID